MDANNFLNQALAKQAATQNAAWAGVSLAIYLFCIWLSWYALGALTWDKWVAFPKSRPAVLLRLLLAIVIGYQVSQFILGYLSSSVLLKGA